MDSTELSSSWQGIFKSYNVTSITIEIKLNEVRALLDTGAICSVSFNFKSQPHIFLTTVKASKLIDDDVVEVELFIPDAIENAGRRALFRVPVLQALGVAASVSIETDTCLDAEIKDINADGARVCLRPDDFAKVKIGDEAVITLSLHDVTLTRATNVRHTDTRNHAIGLHFLLTSDEREEEALRTIVREAEAFYMRRVQRLD
ncbi:MAG: PilZ domain-containing protein [Burkholderiales bacterium]|nr:PilZ domain-containing protein [Burkholderiales bacterium]